VALINISIQNQTLEWAGDGSRAGERRVYAISSAARGVGEVRGSFCTPRGLHEVRAKIGAGACKLAVFVGRRATGEEHGDELDRLHPERDWMLGRILWLGGLEHGFNKGGDRDTMRRHIYIHGCPDRCEMGVPASRGCIRMRCEDLVELFAAVEVGAKVHIRAIDIRD
jgi:L,D-transpeptidase YbiS